MPRTVKPPEERRREIVAAARELFQQKQYDNTTMRDVMEALGIAKGTIYHYFDSKEALLEAVVAQSVEDFVSRMRAILDEAEGDGLSKLLLLVAAGDVADEQAEIVDLLHRPGNVGMHTRQLAVLVSKLAPLYEAVIRQGCEEGIFQTEHPLESAELLLAGIQLLSDVGIHPWSPEALARRARAFPALIEAQLGAPRGTLDALRERL